MLDFEEVNKELGVSIGSDKTGGPSTVNENLNLLLITNTWTVK